LTRSVLRLARRTVTLYFLFGSKIEFSKVVPFFLVVEVYECRGEKTGRPLVSRRTLIFDHFYGVFFMDL
jgi:hypothetical protein